MPRWSLKGHVKQNVCGWRRDIRSLRNDAVGFDLSMWARGLEKGMESPCEVGLEARPRGRSRQILSVLHSKENLRKLIGYETWTNVNWISESGKRL